MKRSELKQIIFECYCKVLTERANRALLKEDADKENNMVFSGNMEEAELPDATDQMLAKFPTLKHCLQRLQSDDFMEFVAGIDWISPRPTSFRINLKNGQNFLLTWQGKDFEADIVGKKYYLGQLADFQQALKKLTLLYQEGPMGQSEEVGDEAGAPGEGGNMGGGLPGGGGTGDFPGGAEGGEELPGAESGSEEGESEEEGGEDLGNEDVNFEADSEI